MQHELLWIELSECLGARSPIFRPLIDAFGTPEAIFSATEAELGEVVGNYSGAALALILHRRRKERAREIWFYCDHAGVRLLPYDHKKYPAVLRELADPPVLLYCKGQLPDLEVYPSVGVVGPRETDEYGEVVAYKLSFEMAAAGAVIVSGLADGIDGIATAGALASGGIPIAVLGCGIDRTYPAHHVKLRAECEGHGAVITEYAPSTPPNAQNFPVRNRLISALSRAVLVVHAPEKSGSLITARYALLQGRALFAVPGDVTKPRSVGSNLLLQMGARPALCAKDVLEPLMPRFHDAISPLALEEAQQYSVLVEEVFKQYGLRSSRSKKTRREKRRMEREEGVATSVAIIGEEPSQSLVASEDLSALTPHQRELYRMLPDGRFSVDALTEKGVSVAEAMSALTIFEVYGLASSVGGGLYEKK